MRDVNRIDVLLDLLKEYWKQEDSLVDLRLGQLLYSIASKLNKDLFYMEDDEVIEWLEKELGKDTHYKCSYENEDNHSGKKLAQAMFRLQRRIQDNMKNVTKTEEELRAELGIKTYGENIE